MTWKVIIILEEYLESINEIKSEKKICMINVMTFFHFSFQ